MDGVLTMIGQFARAHEVHHQTTCKIKLCEPMAPLDTFGGVAAALVTPLIEDSKQVLVFGGHPQFWPHMT